MAGLTCKLVKLITGKPEAIVTLPQLPEKNAVLKVRRGDKAVYFRVQAVAYEATDELERIAGPEMKPGYLIVVTEASEASLDPANA